MLARTTLALLLMLLCAAPALADWPARAEVRVCPARADQTAPPDFNASHCHTTRYWTADPQGRAVWIEAIIDIDAPPEPVSSPLALLVSGKMAFEARVNGAVIGANGVPAFDQAHERPGRMDAAVFLPADALQPGANRVVLFASGHHSLIALANPIHRIAIGPYRDPSRDVLAGYQSALITLGVFGLAAVFFSVLAALSPRRGLRALLAAIAGLAGAQLLAETGRGLVAYAYPVHDLRLMAIAAGAALLSLSAAGWSALRFLPRAPGLQASILAGLGLALTVILLSAPGFDQKAGYALLLAAGASAAPPAFRAWRDRRPAPALWALGFIGFAASGPLAPQALLDQTLFWALSALLLVNLVDEARRFARERAARLNEARRADALAAALARAEQAAGPVQIALNSSGRTDYADAARIARLDAADDYVEVRFKDGRRMLHTGTLAGLETRLPATFLRVHRSCIVNMEEITALERDANGAGRLILKSGGEAPVSRRILPAVKAALANG